MGWMIRQLLNSEVYEIYFVEFRAPSEVKDWLTAR